jgi:hypothetical protein
MESHDGFVLRHVFLAEGLLDCLERIGIDISCWKEFLLVLTDVLTENRLEHLGKLLIVRDEYFLDFLHAAAEVAYLGCRVSFGSLPLQVLLGDVVCKVLLLCQICLPLLLHGPQLGMYFHR